MVFQRNFLRAQNLLDRFRPPRTGLHRRIVRDDDHLAAVDDGDAGVEPMDGAMPEGGFGQFAAARLDRGLVGDLPQRVDAGVGAPGTQGDDTICIGEFGQAGLQLVLHSQARQLALPALVGLAVVANAERPPHKTILIRAKRFRKMWADG